MLNPPGFSDKMSDINQSGVETFQRCFALKTGKYCTLINTTACSYPLVISLMFMLTFGCLALAQKTWAPQDNGILAEKFSGVVELQEFIYEQVLGIRSDMGRIDQKIDANERIVQQRFEEREKRDEERHRKLQKLISEADGKLELTAEVLADALISVDHRPLFTHNHHHFPAPIVKQTTGYF